MVCRCLCYVYPVVTQISCEISCNLRQPENPPRALMLSQPERITYGTKDTSVVKLMSFDLAQILDAHTLEKPTWGAPEYMRKYMVCVVEGANHKQTPGVVLVMGKSNSSPTHPPPGRPILHVRALITTFSRRARSQQP